jgi:hypothetical protein
MRYIIAVVILAVAIPASVAVKNHLERYPASMYSNGSVAPIAGVQVPPLARRHPAWATPVALAVVITGIGAAGLLTLSGTVKGK